MRYSPDAYLDPAVVEGGHRTFKDVDNRLVYYLVLDGTGAEREEVLLVLLVNRHIDYLFSVCNNG